MTRACANCRRLEDRLNRALRTIKRMSDVQAERGLRDPELARSVAKTINVFDAAVSAPKTFKPLKGKKPMPILPPACKTCGTAEWGHVCAGRVSPAQLRQIVKKPARDNTDAAPVTRRASKTKPKRAKKR